MFDYVPQKKLHRPVMARNPSFFAFFYVRLCFGPPMPPSAMRLGQTMSTYSGLGSVRAMVSLFVSVTTGRHRSPAIAKKSVFSCIFFFRLFSKVLAATCPSLQNTPIFRGDSIFVYRTNDSRFSIFDSGEIAALKLPIQNPKSKIPNPKSKIQNQ